MSNETVVVAVRHEEAVNWLNEQPYRFAIMTKGLPEGTRNNQVRDEATALPHHHHHRTTDATSITHTRVRCTLRRGIVD